MSRRPGTVKAVYDIALPYPRDAFALRGASEFVELEATIWNALRDEFRAPVEQGAGAPPVRGAHRTKHECHARLQIARRDQRPHHRAGEGSAEARSEVA